MSYRKLLQRGRMVMQSIGPTRMPFAEPLTIPTDPAKLAYVAGLIDGEGCIHIGRHLPKGIRKNIRHTLVVHISNTDARLMAWLKSELGGSVHLVKQRRASVASDGRVIQPMLQMMNWFAGGRNAQMVLEAVLPYLIIKRDQAEIAIEFRKLFSNTTRRVAKHMPDGLVEKREALRMQLVATRAS